MVRPGGKDEEGVKLGRWHSRRRVESGDVSNDRTAGALPRLVQTGRMLGPLLVLVAVAALLLGGAQRATASPDHVFTVSTTADAGDAFPGDGTCADSAGQCSFRAAVDEAEALGGTSEIDLYPGTFDLTLDQLEVGGNITIRGAGADQTTIEQLAATHRAFEVTSGTVSITGTTITGGGETMNSTDPDPGVGGGIYVAGGATLDLSWAEVMGNGAESSGGGIDLNGSVEIDHSTIANNTVSGLHFGNGIGGGVDDFGASLTITDSTIYGNTASLQGGGLLSASSTTLSNDTIVGNGAPTGGGVFVYGGAAISTVNTILVGNSGQCGNGTLDSVGGNISGDSTCGLTGPGDQQNVDDAFLARSRTTAGRPTRCSPDRPALRLTPGWTAPAPPMTSGE